MARFEIEIIELVSVDGSGARTPRLSLASVFVATLDRAHGSASRHDQPAEAVDVVSYLPPSIATGSRKLRWRLHPRLAAPADRLQIARAIRAGLPSLNPSDICHFVVPLVDGEIGPTERWDLDLDEPIVVSARVETELLTHTANSAAEPFDNGAGQPIKRFVPVLTVRLPQALDKVDFLAKFARCVHWRRQEDYVRLQREDAQSFRTGDAIVDGLLRLPAPPDNPTRHARRDRGLYSYDMPFAEPSREGGEFVFKFRFPGIQYGDVFGLVFGPRGVRIAVPAAAPNDGPRARGGKRVDELSADEFPLFVFRGEDVNDFAAEPVLLSYDSLKSDIPQLVNEVRRQILETSPRIFDAESLFRLAAGRDPELAGAAERDADIAPDFGSILPIPALDAYRLLPRNERASAASAGEAVLDDAVRASLLSQQTFRDEPAFVAAVVNDPTLFTMVLRNRAWLPDRVRSSQRWPCAIPYVLEMAGFTESLTAWIEALPAPATFISWLLLSNGSLDLLRWLADMNVVPDETLLADMQFPCTNPGPRHSEHLAFEKLREFADIGSDVWAKLESQPWAIAHSQLRKLVGVALARASSNRSTERVTYTEVLLLLEAMRRLDR
jgi:hypothetical protein